MCGLPASREQVADGCVWRQVTYFKQWRVADHQKRQTLERLKAEGANMIPLQRDSDVPAAPKKKPTS